MSGDLQTFVVDLSNGVEFSYLLPEPGDRIFFGEISGTPDLASQVIELIGADSETSCKSSSMLSCVRCTSQPGTLIVFTEDRREWLIERLRAIVPEMSGRCR